MCAMHFYSKTAPFGKTQFLQPEFLLVEFNEVVLYFDLEICFPLLYSIHFQNLLPFDTDFFFAEHQCDPYFDSSIQLLRWLRNNFGKINSYFICSTTNDSS